MKVHIQQQLYKGISSLLVPTIFRPGCFPFTLLLPPFSYSLHESFAERRQIKSRSLSRPDLSGLRQIWVIESKLVTVFKNYDHVDLPADVRDE